MFEGLGSSHGIISSSKDKETLVNRALIAQRLWSLPCLLRCRIFMWTSIQHSTTHDLFLGSNVLLQPGKDLSMPH